AEGKSDGEESPAEKEEEKEEEEAEKEEEEETAEEKLEDDVLRRSPRNRKRLTKASCIIPSQQHLSRIKPAGSVRPVRRAATN
ncbi:hypothetical protein NQZ68_042413, partial [Dissostichus eleginoides]